jgi:NTP pyrophosphatase (non-canonical NTP hydrolase)
VRDSETTVAELKKVARRFSDDRDWGKYHVARDLAIGLVTEASELLQEFRFKSDAEIEEIFRSPAPRERIADEIADTMYFLLEFSERYDLDLSTEFIRKMKKNEERYPVEKARGSNKKYTEL